MHQPAGQKVGNMNVKQMPPVSVCPLCGYNHEQYPQGQGGAPQRYSLRRHVNPQGAALQPQQKTERPHLFLNCRTRGIGSRHHAAHNARRIASRPSFRLANTFDGHPRWHSGGRFRKSKCPRQQPAKQIFCPVNSCFASKNNRRIDRVNTARYFRQQHPARPQCPLKQMVFAHNPAIVQG